MVLQSHLCRVLDLEIRSTEELASSRCAHGTSYPHLTLAAYLSPRDGGIGADDIGEEPRRGQCSEDALVGEVSARLQMVEHGGDDATAPAGRGSDDLPPRGIVLTDGKSIGVDEPSILDARRAIALGLDLVERCLATQTQAPGEYSFGGEPRMDSSLHHLPDLCQIVPDLPALVVLDILPVGSILLMDTMHDVDDPAVGVDGGGLLLVELLIGQRPTSDTEDRIGV